MVRTHLALAALCIAATVPQTTAQVIRLDHLPSGILARSSSTHRLDDETHTAAHDDEILSCCSNEGYTARPDAHAPIGVMFNHMHTAGEWMVGVTQMDMHMEGLRDGNSGISRKKTFAKGYMVAPTEMDMDMTMLHTMYAPTDEVTLMVMMPWISNSMDHVTGTGVKFTTESEGWGDTTLGAMYRVHEGDGDHVHAQLGFSLPTGSINQKDKTPASGGKDVILPYPMQLGTGTYDLIPGITYSGATEDWSWGAQGQVRLHMGKNSNHYRRGTRAELTGWVAKPLSDNASTSVRVKHSIQNNIRGADPDLNPNMVPTANPALQGGQRTDLFFGVNMQGTEGLLTGHRLSVEVGFPVYQNLDGPQLEVDRTIVFGWQKAF